MDESEYTKLFIDISKNLGEINSKIGSLCEVIAKHEVRITTLEANKIGFKDSVVKYLTIALIGCVSVIVTLTGATGILRLLIGS